MPAYSPQVSTARNSCLLWSTFTNWMLFIGRGFLLARRSPLLRHSEAIWSRKISCLITQATSHCVISAYASWTWRTTIKPIRSVELPNIWHLKFCAVMGMVCICILLFAKILWRWDLRQGDWLVDARRALVWDARWFTSVLRWYVNVRIRTFGVLIKWIQKRTPIPCTKKYWMTPFDLGKSSALKLAAFSPAFWTAIPPIDWEWKAPMRSNVIPSSINISISGILLRRKYSHLSNPALLAQLCAPFLLSFLVVFWIIAGCLQLWYGLYWRGTRWQLCWGFQLVADSPSPIQR